MLVKKSRYAKARGFTPDENGVPVFPGLRAREIGAATGVLEHEIQAGDRLDLLARHYYNDDRLWWRIVDANPDITFAHDLLGESLSGRVLLIASVDEQRS